jgi:sec-independent protein translocase protein TatB
MFPEGRFFDFVIVAILALIIIGPKDLPMVMRKVGQFLARMRGMAAEFRASFDELARQSELDELRKEVEALRNVNPTAMAAQAVGLGEAHADVTQTFSDIQAGMTGGYQHPEDPMTAEPEPVMTPLPTPTPPVVSTAPPPEEPTPPEPPKPPRKRAPRKPKTETPT